MLSSHARLRMLCLVLSLLLVGSMLPGCAKMPGGPVGIDEYKPLLRMAVSIGVDRLLVANPEIAPILAKVTKVLEDLFDRGQFTSVAELGSFMQAHVPWGKIDVQTRPLVETMIVAISEELRVLMVQYQIPESQNLLLAREVMTWVREVALSHMDVPRKVRKVRA